MDLNCLNCDAVVTGRYCAQCGQTAQQSRPTLGHFVAEGFKSLTNSDSRLWWTLWCLVSKPGFLTKEFFEGRRARYLPPIRLYLVLSVTFFLLINVMPAEDPAGEGLQWLEIEADCSELEYRGPFGNYMKEKLEEACVSLKKAGNGEAIANAFLSNLPKAMWFGLPLYAAFMMILWWQPRRLYAEHLLFLVNNHSAMFAMLILDSLTTVIPDVIEVWISTAIISFLIWYNWRALRVFYGDSTPIALTKFFVLGLVYLLLATLILVLTGVLSAITF